VRRLFSGRRFNDEVRRELDFHLAMESAERERRGLPAVEAHRTAMRDFGGVERIHEEVRDVRGMTFWDSLVQDLRFGFRTLRRSPGYTAAAILILALGIGANTAMFSVVDGVLLKPLPFKSGDDLVIIRQAALKSNRANVGVSIQELFDYRKRLTTIRDLVEWHSMSFVLLNQGDPDRVDTAVVSANFFDMLGVRPALGRTFVDEDDNLGAEAVLVLSHAYWTSKFGADPGVVGRVLQMNNRPHTVVGVLPEYPQYPQEADVYMPTSACPFRAASEETPRQGHRSFAALSVFGRLAPGAMLQEATQEVNTVAGSYEVAYPREHQQFRALGFTGQALSLPEQLVTGARPMLLALTGATFLVLMIACANVANLSLARTLHRSRELAVRTALGAGRGRLMRQLVTESIIVALAGGVIGIVLAWVSLDLLKSFVGRFTERTGQIEIDGVVLLFALVASVITGVFFGLAPALSTRRNLSQSIRDGAAQGGEGASRHRVRSGLVVAQVSVSFVLVVAAALLLQSLYRLSSVPLGYDADKVLSAAIYGNFTTQGNATVAARTENTILERLRSSPGVRAAALASSVPQSAIQPGNQPIILEGFESGQSQGASGLQADPNFASEGYFDTLGVPMMAGRDFRASDDTQAPPVAVINASMAKLWKGADPIGRRFAVAPSRPDVAPNWITVIGVASDFRLYSAEIAVDSQYFLAVRQFPGTGTRVLARADGDPRALGPVIRAAVHAADPASPVESLQTLAEVRGTTQLAAPALTAVLLSIFAAVAMLITLAGVAGVIGTSVSQRTREFGLRMALGATRMSVLRLVLSQGVILVVIGIAIGLAGAYGFSQLLTRYLFQTAPTDTGAYALVAALFAIAAMVAALGPARRATTIDPLKALKAD
ncbi:MAG TPA: ABC transporter permease, partial [Vicinamibacterales bacterium]|nr:ABC transporter permease [Vicinamibacterales bacterium]